MACFGTGGTNARNRRLVGDSPRLPVRAIPKWGTVTLEWPQNTARALHAKVTRSAADRIVISTAGVEVEVALREWPMPTVRGRQRGIRTRMVCPRCEASRDALHWIGEWGCRGCFQISYPCRHRERFCPAIARRARLLRKLIRVRPGSLKAQALREKIAQQESAMLASVKRTNGDLVKRRQRYADRVDSSQRTG
jgi:hypothetical protein